MTKLPKAVKIGLPTTWPFVLEDEETAEEWLERYRRRCAVARLFELRPEEEVLMLKDGTLTQVVDQIQLGENGQNYYMTLTITFAPDDGNVWIWNWRRKHRAEKRTVPPPIVEIAPIFHTDLM